MKFAFDIDVATKYGVEEAVLIHNIGFWIGINKKNGTNYYQSRTWTFNSAASFAKLFPFWKQRKIARLLNSLVKQKVLVKSNFNRHRYDRTSWYAFYDESEFLVEEHNEKSNKHEDQQNDRKWNPSSDFDKSIVKKERMDAHTLTNQVTQNDPTIPNINTVLSSDVNKEVAAAAGEAIKYLREAWRRKLLPREEFKLKEMVQCYGLERVKYSINESVEHNILKLSYLLGILLSNQNSKKLDSPIRKVEAGNRGKSNVKKNGGLVTYDCTEINCGNPIVLQQEQLLKAIELTIPIICTKCNNSYSAQYISENGKIL